MRADGFGEAAEHGDYGSYRRSTDRAEFAEDIASVEPEQPEELTEVNTFLIEDRILNHMHSSFPGWEIPKFRPEHFTNDCGFIVFLLLELSAIRQRG